MDDHVTGLQAVGGEALGGSSIAAGGSVIAVGISRVVTSWRTVVRRHRTWASAILWAGLSYNINHTSVTAWLAQWLCDLQCLTQHEYSWLSTDQTTPSIKLGAVIDAERQESTQLCRTFKGNQIKQAWTLTATLATREERKVRTVSIWIAKSLPSAIPLSAGGSVIKRKMWLFNPIKNYLCLDYKNLSRELTE